nr:hypothetical protein [uncultured Methylotenera sp.]
MILERITTWRNSIFNIGTEHEANTTELHPADLDAKFREEESWLGIG